MAKLLLFANRKLKNRVSLTLVTLLTVTLCCVFYTTQLTIKEDISALVPSSPPSFRHAFTLLNESPFSQVMTVTVGGKEPIQKHVIDSFTQHLGNTGISEVISGIQQIQPIDFAQQLILLSPALMSETALDAMKRSIEARSMEEAVSKTKHIMQTPAGIALGPILALDPLGISSETLSGLSQFSTPGNIQIHDGYFLNADKRYALLIAKSDMPMTDTASARAVMDIYRSAKDKLPPDTEVYMAGGYPYTEANADIIQHDLAKILPISLLMLTITFLLFLRSKQGLFIFLVPLVAFNVACAAAAFLFQSISGIVIGFGSVILGIASDYPIHVYYSLRNAPTHEEGIRRVSTPLLLGALSTAGVFASFLTSSIPALMQMGTLAIIGILVAALCALVIIPLLVHPDPHPILSEGTPYTCIPAIPVRLYITWGIILVCLGTAISQIQIDGDIRNLAYSTPEIIKDEEKTREVWGGMREASLIAVEASSLEEALTLNEKVWNILTDHKATKGVTSLAPLLPPQELQQQRIQKWTSFWEHNSNNAIEVLTETAVNQGFSKKAFAPFIQWIQTPPPFIQPSQLKELGMGLIADLFIKQQYASTLIFTSLSDKGSLSDDVVRKLRKVPATLVSGEAFRAEIQEVTQQELFSFIAIAFVIVTLCSALYYKDIRTLAIVLIPPILSVTFLLMIFSFFSCPIRIFHAISIPLVMTLSLDYSIFMLSYLQGTLEKDTPKGVLLSAVTTISSFGCLILADHPALFSIGITVTGGMSMAILSSLILLPALFKVR